MTFFSYKVGTESWILGNYGNVHCDVKDNFAKNGGRLKNLKALKRKLFLDNRVSFRLTDIWGDKTEIPSIFVAKRLSPKVANLLGPY